MDDRTIHFSLPLLLSHIICHYCIVEQWSWCTVLQWYRMVIFQLCVYCFEDYVWIDGQSIKDMYFTSHSLSSVDNEMVSNTHVYIILPQNRKGHVCIVFKKSVLLAMRCCSCFLDGLQCVTQQSISYVWVRTK